MKGRERDKKIDKARKEVEEKEKNTKREQEEGRKG